MNRRVFAAVVCAMAAPAAWHTSHAAGPDVRWLLPSGGQRSATVAVSAGGNFPTWPVGAWVDRPGLTVTPADEKGKLSVAIAADAPPGMYWIRLTDAQGAAAPRPFVVGTLGELLEEESNDAPPEATATPSSAVVANGRLGRGGDVDHFEVGLDAGQTIVASLAAHETLGSPIDAVMHVVSDAGYQLAYNHDRRGLDPEIVFTAPADGKYLVRVFGFPADPNSSIGFAGNDRYVYRLTLATTGFVDYPWPLAIERNRETPVVLVGWNIPESLKTVTVQPADDAETLQIADAQLANVAVVAVEAHPTLVENEPNGPEAPQAIELPSTISGRIDPPGDVDAFGFAGNKGASVVFRLESRALGYPLDAVLEVTDENGKSLARVDDAAGTPDPVLAFSPPADGTFRVAVSDLSRQGSPRHVYRLRAAPAEPDFAVTADNHAYTVTPEKPAEITLSIDRQNGFAEPIEFSASGLPEFVTAAPATSPASGDEAKTVKLSLTSGGGTFSGPIRILGAAAGAGKWSRAATAAIPDHTARVTDLWLTAGDAKK